MKKWKKFNNTVVLICSVLFLVSACTKSYDEDLSKNALNNKITTTTEQIPASEEKKELKPTPNDKTAIDIKIDGVMPNGYNFELNGEQVQFMREDFQFKYPKEWIASREPDFWDSDPKIQRQSSPEQGISLHIDKNNSEKVSVYSAYYPWDDGLEKERIDQGFEKRTYQSGNGLKWNVLTGKQNNKKMVIYGINNPKTACAYVVEVFLSDKNYLKYEKDITKVLDSVKLN